MTTESALPTFRLPGSASIAQAQYDRNAPVTPDSPALEVMTDLTQVKAATVSPRATLAQAEQTMIYQGVRLLFVVSDMPAIEGLITLVDLQGERPMRVVNQRGVHHDELVVADVMTKLSGLDAIDFAQLSHAKVSNLIATLMKFGRHHLLVVDSAGDQGPWRIRGVISKTQIERQLGQQIDLTEIAGSFAEIEKALS
jgi:CBS-domain-containing membrane protein